MSIVSSAIQANIVYQHGVQSRSTCWCCIFYNNFDSEIAFTFAVEPIMSW